MFERDSTNFTFIITTVSFVLLIFIILLISTFIYRNILEKQKKLKAEIDKQNNRLSKDSIENSYEYINYNEIVLTDYYDNMEPWNYGSMEHYGTKHLS